MAVADTGILDVRIPAAPDTLALAKTHIDDVLLCLVATARLGGDNLHKLAVAAKGLGELLVQIAQLELASTADSAVYNVIFNTSTVVEKVELAEKALEDKKE